MIGISLKNGDVVDKVITGGQTYYPLDSPFTVTESGVYLIGVTNEGNGFIDPTCYPDLESAVKAISERSEHD